MADTRITHLIGIAGCLAALVACAQVPELDDAISDTVRDADYPQLVPIETLLAPLPSPDTDISTTQQDLQARRDALRQRADRLNSPVVDAETQARMKAGVDG